jgi:ribosomal-protein-alanine N-acetyltransferase
MTPGYHIRWLIRRDLPEVMAVEHATAPDPWGEDDFLRFFRQRNCIGMAAEHGEVVAGFMAYVLHKRRIEVVRLAVRPDLVRLGVGTAMADKLKAKLAPHRRTELTLVCDERQESGHRFLRASGFTATGVARGWADCGSDGYVFRYAIQGEAAGSAAGAGREQPHDGRS